MYKFSLNPVREIFKSRKAKSLLKLAIYYYLFQET